MTTPCEFRGCEPSLLPPGVLLTFTLAVVWTLSPTVIVVGVGFAVTAVASFE